MTTAASVDKLELHAPRDTFRVRDMGSGLWHRQHIVQGLTHDAKPMQAWATDAKGTPIYGQLQAQIPMGNTVLAVSANSYGVRVTVNPNKAVHAYIPLQDTAQLVEVFGEVERAVSQLVSTDVLGMVTQRVDLCRQATTSEPVWKYADALRTCKPPRKQMFPEPGGLRYGTAKQSVQTCFYDLGRRAAEVDRVDGMPDNIARLEPRFNSVQAVSKNIGVGNVRQLLELGTDDLTKAYIRSVNAEVFRLMPATASHVGQFVIPYAQAVQELQVYFDAYGRRGMAARRFRAALGADALLQRFGTFDRYRSTLVEHFGIERTAAWREARQAEQDWKLMPTAKRKTSASAYLRELQEHFAA
jgi:hypothetical protein